MEVENCRKRENILSKIIYLQQHITFTAHEVVAEKNKHATQIKIVADACANSALKKHTNPFMVHMVPAQFRHPWSI